MNQAFKAMYVSSRINICVKISIQILAFRIKTLAEVVIGDDQIFLLEECHLEAALQIKVVH